MSCEICGAGISEEEFIIMQKRKVIMLNKRYIESMTRALKTLKKLRIKKDKDRLDNLYILFTMIAMMRSSIEGWHKWCNIQKMYQVFEKKEDLEKLVNEMAETVTKWIRMDIDATNVAIKSMEQDTIKSATKIKKKKKKKVGSKPESKTTMYVA